MSQHYSLAEVRILRDTAFRAYMEALSSKSYGIGSRNTQRQDLTALKKELNFWDAYLAMKLGEGSQIEVRDIVPVDPPMNPFHETHTY